MSHRPVSRPRRTVLASALALGLLPALSVTPAFGQASPAAAPTDLRIGFQKGSIALALLRQQGLLERRLPGTRVRWVEFPAGPQLLEALAVGSIDVGSTGDAPPVFAQAAGKDLVYVGAEAPKPDASAILVRADSPIRQARDLKGRRIALQKGSSAHYLLVRAIEQAGLAWGDIEPIWLTPAEARAAFEKGSVDAWVIWDPYYAAAEVDGRARVLLTGRALSGNNSFYLASPGFAADHGATLQTLFAALTESDRLLQQDRRAAAALYADFAGLSLGTVLRVLSRRPPSPVGPVTPALVAEQQRVADTFHRLGLIPRAIQVAAIVRQPGQRLASAR